MLIDPRKGESDKGEKGLSEKKHKKNELKTLRCCRINVSDDVLQAVEVIRLGCTGVETPSSKSHDLMTMRPAQSHSVHRSLSSDPACFGRS